MKTGKGWEPAHHNKMASLDENLQSVQNCIQAMLKGRKFFGVISIGLQVAASLIATKLENNFNYIYR